MNKRVKVDIIIESIKLNDLIDILEKEGVPGYTVIGNISGRGENGTMDHNCKARIFENSYLFVVCSEELSKKLLDAVNVILKHYSGACFVSEIVNVEMYHRNI